MRVGWVQIGDFRPITRRISETVRDTTRETTELCLKKLFKTVMKQHAGSPNTSGQIQRVDQQSNATSTFSAENKQN